VVAIYSSLQTLKWLKNLGGLAAMKKINEEKAKLLYQEIDGNRLFKGTVENPAHRSIMNICFVMKDEYKELEASFQEFASSKGLVGIKGHRSVGGFRASLYNALPKESVEALIEAMKEFERKN
jgi:phosphoserine aminotransferase